MEALISVVTVWLSLTFGLPAAAEHPQIRHVPVQHMTSLRSATTVAAEREHTVLGTYDPRTRTILLRDDWDSRNPADVSVLVHELVHYLQDRAALRYECAGERETLAYDAQQRWLKLFGKDLRSAFELDALMLKVRTACFPY